VADLTAAGRFCCAAREVRFGVDKGFLFRVGKTWGLGIANLDQMGQRTGLLQADGALVCKGRAAMAVGAGQGGGRVGHHSSRAEVGDGVPRPARRGWGGKADGETLDGALTDQ
jgi:hypothetical protein